MRHNSSLSVCTDQRLTPHIGAMCRTIRERNGVTMPQMSRKYNILTKTLSRFELGHMRNAHLLMVYMAEFADDILVSDFEDFIKAIHYYGEEY